MARARLADIDLNLLVAADALIDERSVTRAARKLGVGQPAMSATLSRLRAMLGDPVLVRTSQGMELTARAAELRQPIREILGRVETTLRPRTRFDPSAAERTFVVCTTDYLELVLAPPLLERIALLAPGIRLEVRGFGDRRFGPELASGAIDLALGHCRDMTAGLYRHVLFQERLTCLVRSDHPTVKGAMTVEQYAHLGHVVVSPRGAGRSEVDEALAARGLDRRIVHRTPHFLAAPAVAARTDLVVTIAARLARTFTTMLPLRVVELPLEIPPVTLGQLWHERTHRDEGHRWLRSLIQEVAASA